jgi:hypothetical protein
MKLFTTTDVAASVRRAHEQFTHVVLNRGYTTIKPVFFMSKTIVDLPLYQYASWMPETENQRLQWGGKGGILIAQDTHLGVPADVTVMVECPYDTDRLNRVHVENAVYGVIPHPKTWRTHEECVDLRYPPVDLLEAIWRVCGGKQMTNSELAQETGLPVHHVQYLKNSLKPDEFWYVQKRLAPERDEFVPAWDWLEGGAVPKRAVTEAGHKAQVEEMARFGYIGLKKMQHYPAAEPDWKVLKKKRETALSDLAAVRLLVESLPDHLST